MKILKANHKLSIDRIVTLLGWTVIFLGLIALTGWITGFLILASFSTEYIPMAVSTIISTMIFGFILLSGAYKPSIGYLKWLVTLMIIIVSLIGLLAFGGYFIYSRSGIESLLFSTKVKVSGFPINLMSPYTGILLLLSGLGLMLNIHKIGNKNLMNVISSLGMTVAFAGFVAMLGYAFGTPFLYGGRIIPLSMPTSIVFLLLGFALICMAGPDNFFLRPFSGNSTNARILRAILPVVLSAIILEDLINVNLYDGQLNPALNLALLTIVFILVTPIVVMKLTKRIFLSVEKTERALIQQKVIFQQLFDSSQMGIAMLDENEKVVTINKKFETIFGFTADEIKGKRINETIFPDDLAEASIDLLVKLLKGEVAEKETQRKRKDGSLLPVHVFGIPIVFEDKLMGFYNMYLDITERKQSEKILKESEDRLQELNATKDKFFSIIAHDLKNPFNSIIGFSNILIEQIQEKNYEGIEKYAGIIRHSSQQAMDLLMNLMEWSRSQSGRMEFNPEYIEMVALINHETELQIDTARQKSISISMELLHDATVFADKAMISTVLRNLISNAIKFTNTGGKIVVSTEQKQTEILLIVSDNGVGIKKNILEKLFRIEESYSTKGTRNETGTGLGLKLCKEFVDKHNGKIWVDSELGKGSKFYVMLPREQ